MRSLLTWIWNGIKAIGRRLKIVGQALWNVLSSFLTWITAGIAYVFSQLENWINSAIQSGIDAFSSGTLSDSMSEASGTFPQLHPIAAYYLDLFSLNTAISLLVLLLGVWVVARTARLAMVPIRAVLELL